MAGRSTFVGGNGLPLDQESGRYIPGIVSEVLGQFNDDDNEPLEGEVIENEDGSASIQKAIKEKQVSGHYENLAETLEESDMSILAQDLVRKIENDKQARSKRDAQYEEGLRRSGLGNDAPGGAQFEGASRAVHPAIAEVCVDFAAAAARELFPPNGPCKSKIEGEVTKEKTATAARQVKCMNWQLTEEISEYCDELEQLLTQLPMGGSQYEKFWHDEVLGRTACQFVPIDDVYIPYSCTNFYSAFRITHAQKLTQAEYEERVETGMYRDITGLAPGQLPETTKAQKANEKIEGKEEDVDNLDGLRIVYEVNTFCKLSVDDEKRLPYLLSIDERTNHVLSIYRNWEEQDALFKRLEWMVEYGFIPWRGAYKIGLPHLIGGLSAAATGALRALLDAAHVQNFPGALKMKSGRIGGQSKKVSPTGITEIEGAANVDDIRKLAMPISQSGPSPTLFQLLGWLTDAIKGVVTTAEEKLADASNQMPVGTALALIEQGAKVFSAIHARLHRSQKRALGIIARLNRQHMNTRNQQEMLGEVLATREDFQHGMFVIPVSDPNIFSEGQRYAQMQMVEQMSQKYPQAHNIHQVLHRIYSLAKIPDIDQLLPPPPEPKEMNFVSENSAILMGQTVMAFPDQDHLAHIEGHMRFFTDPLLGGSPNAAHITLPKGMEHIKQHIGFYYAKTMYEIASEAVGAPLEQFMQAKDSHSPDVDRVLAAASKIVHARMMQEFQPLGPVITQVVQQVMQMQPPQQMDATAGALQIAKMDNERKSEIDKQGVAIKAQSMQNDKAKTDAELQLQHAEQERKRLRDEADVFLKQQQLDDNRVADGTKLRIEAERAVAQIQHQELQLEEARQSGNQVPGA